MYALKWTFQELNGETVFTVQHPDLPGCMVVGTDPATALEELDAVREDWIALALESGIPVPPERESPTVVEWETIPAGYRSLRMDETFAGPTAYFPVAGLQVA